MALLLKFIVELCLNYNFFKQLQKKQVKHFQIIAQEGSLKKKEL